MARIEVARPGSGVPVAWNRVLAVVVAATVLVWAGCKLALFADLEYFGSDFYSCLQMSKSFRYTGVPLYENVYGRVGAIHNNYLLLLFFPLTYPLGGYGLILGFAGLHALAACRVLRTPVLSFWGRVTVLGTMLSPVSFWVFDHPMWGFHTELCYPALAVLLTLPLLERRPVVAVVAALAMALVKEDGIVLVAAILLAYFGTRLVREPGERRRLFRHAALGLTACVLVFLAGLAWLSLASQHLDGVQVTSASRLQTAFELTQKTLSGDADPMFAERLREGLVGYALLVISCGLPLRARLRPYLLCVLAGCVPLLPVLVLSSAPYAFGVVFWPPRVALLLALVAACLLITASATPEASFPAARPRLALLTSLVLVALGWVLQWCWLEWRLDYHVLARANLPALLAGRGYVIDQVREPELRFARCLAAGLPRDMPLLTAGRQSPIFHHQALVFPGPPSHPWEVPRLGVEFRKRGTGYPPRTLARVGRLFVAGDEEYAPLARRCADSATASSLRPGVGVR